MDKKPSDTPYKSLDLHSQGAYVTSADEVRKRVEIELQNIYIAADTDLFLEKIVPVTNGKVTTILDDLKKKRLYNGKKWKNMPKSGAVEAKFYKSFVDIANEVKEIAIERKYIPEDAIRGRWIDCSHTKPRSADASAAAIRPDLSYVSITTSTTVLDDANKRIELLEEALGDRREAARKALRESALAKNLEKENNLLRVWWLQMLNVVEVKKIETEAEVNSALLQLCGYARQIFREQLDRRFVIGLTLCFDQLRVYLFDRSGVMGTAKAINIHQEPEKFVQVLAAYAMLQAEQLGWDPTMKLYKSGEALYSYTYPWVDLPKPMTLYHNQWVIKMSNGQDFVTVRTISIVGAEIMCGRATVVWEVMKLSDFSEKKVNGEVFVLKQSWQRLPGQQHDKSLDTAPFEGFAHRKANMYDKRLEAAEYVLKERPIRTLEDIRKGISSSTASMEVSDDKREHGNGHRELFPQYTYWGASKQETSLLGSISIPATRTQTRLLMKTRGFTLKHFVNLHELILATRNAVQDHSDFYDAGVLHRDGSLGNIVILHPRHPRSDKIGRLIDLDHAKTTEAFEVSPHNAFPAAVIPPIITLLANRGVYVTEQVARVACEVMEYSNVIGYIFAVVERFSPPSSKDKPLTPQDFHWRELSEMQRRPSFTDHTTGFGVRTGTVPFMSHELLSELFIRHDAVHDMESFWWIIVHLALTRNGPAGKRPDIPQSVHLLFDGPESVLRVSKSSLFFLKEKDKTHRNHPENILESLLNDFHPYFDDLKITVRKWWHLLFVAFQFRSGYEWMDIHYHVLRLLDEAITILGTKKPFWNETIENPEVARRAKWDEEFQQAINEQSVAMALEPITPAKGQKRVANADDDTDEAQEAPSPTQPAAKRPKHK